MRSRLSANKAFYVLFVASLLFGFLLIKLITKTAPLTVSHAIYYCQQAISNLVISLPHEFPPILVFVSLLIFSAGLGLLAFKVSRTHYFIKRMLNKKIHTHYSVEKISQELSIEGKVDVIEVPEATSFCYGLLRPRICISKKLIEILDEGELRAILIHEKYHLINRDPLKILLSQIVSTVFFFLPSLRDIERYYTLSKEVAADQLVVQAKAVRELRSALAKSLNLPTPAISGVAPFAGDIEERIKMLTAKSEKVDFRFSVVRVMGSGVVLVAILTFLNLPVYAIENDDNTHSYFLCTNSKECMLSCTKEGVSEDLPFSREGNFTPIQNYSSPFTP